MPMDEKQFAKTWKAWRQTDVLKKGFITDCALPKNEDYVTVEDIAEDAPPTSVDEVYCVSKPEKIQQLGVGAAQQLLKGALTGVTPESGAKTVVLVLDLTMHAGDIAKGFLSEHFGSSTNLQTYYLGFCKNETEANTGP